MNIIQAIWKAILAFIASWRQSKAEETEQEQAIQDKIVTDVQEAIVKVPEETDEELLDHAIDLGLVDAGMQSSDSGRSQGLHSNHRATDTPYDKIFSQTKK